MIGIKDSNAVLDYTVDWRDALTDGERIAESSWTVEPQETNGLSINATGGVDAQRWANVRQGLPGHVYRLTNHVKTTLDRADERSFIIRIVER